MRKTIAVLSLLGLVAVMTLCGARPALAGGSLETYDITGSVPVPDAPGLIEARVIPIRWDSRCIPVAFRVDSTFDPIPNPLGPPVVTLNQAERTIDKAFDSWNDLRTSFIKMNRVGRVANPAAGFDTLNEVTFAVPPGSGFIGLTVPTSLISDFTFTAGLDIDGDGDSDVAAGITTCTDVDHDGDVEFPPGLYKAGTILDNDVYFNTGDYRLTVKDVDIDTNTQSVDLQGVALHEFGHSHGLAHALGNQISATDGNGATMFPFIDTGDPASELSERSLDSDDIAYSSFLYPEGSAASGPAALQAGDIPFNLVYGIVQGDATQGDFDQPLAGGSVFAVNSLTGEQKATAQTGTTRLAFDPNTGGLFLISPDYNIINGRYRLPLPLGIYKLGIEAIDGSPVAVSSLGYTSQIGSAFGQLNFDEELWNGPAESAHEARPGVWLPVVAIPSITTPHVDFTTNVTADLANFGPITSIGFTGVSAGTYYAVRFPAAQVTSLNPDTITTGLFGTYVGNASVVPIFAKAMLAKGSVNATTGVATIDIAHPLRIEAPFVAQESDFSPMYFDNPVALTNQIAAGISSGSITDLFLVLQIPTTTPFPGVAGLPPFIGISNVAPFGTSFFSSTGASFSPVTFNFQFALGTTPH